MAIAIEDIFDWESFEAWLNNQPDEVAHLLAMRIALRTLSNVFSVFSVDEPELTADIARNLTLYSFRANFISWVARNYPTHDMRAALSAALSGSAARSAALSAALSAAYPADSAARSAAYSAARSAARSAALSAALSAANSARSAARSAADSADSAGSAARSANSAVWENIQLDASAVLKGGASAVGAAPLWPDAGNQNSSQILQTAAQDQISQFQKNEEYTALPWGFWVAWWENLQDDTSKSLFGEKADLKIAEKDDAFWDRDVDVVMAELAKIVGWPWGEELPQDPRAAEMVVNAEGQIDAKESDPADLLLDTPQQREEYDDLRADALELQDFGQQLGKLQSELDSFLKELPEDFTAARVRPLWRAGNRLRKTLKIHRTLEDYPEPHNARLDPEIAEELANLLESFNNFSFSDPGLRRRDERKIPPQERASLEAENKQAKPLIEDLLDKELLTDAAKEEIEQDSDPDDTETDNIYEDQLNEQAVIQNRNLFAAALSGARKLIKSGTDEMKRALRLAADATYKLTGPAAAIAVGSELFGLTTYHVALVNFVVRNANALKDYALTAYPGSPAQHIIDAIVRLFT